MRWIRIPVVLILGLAMSCQSSSERCTGAQNLEPAHAELLACSGWLDFVTDNVCSIEYVPVIPAESPVSQVFGRANCLNGVIAVATSDIRNARPLPPPLALEEILKTIVHEAAHQAEDCAPGEAGALAVEEEFLDDLCLRIQDRSCPLNGVENLGSEFVRSCIN